MRKKEGSFVNIKLEQSLKDRLDIYCEKEDRTMTAAIERALKEFLDKYDSKIINDK